MKTFYLLILIIFFSCLGLKNKTQDKAHVYYFYFDAKKETMMKYPKKRNDGRSLKFLYKLDNTDDVIFISRDKKTRSNPKRIKIKPKDTINLNIKHRSWLNKMSNDEKYAFFLKKSNKKYHLIEKDTLDNELYLIKNMGFSEEID